MATPRALVFFNPAAGRNQRHRRRQLDRLQLALAREQWTVAVREEPVASGAGPSAWSGCDAVIACGGDGTLHALAQELARAESSGHTVPALAVAPPFGTANILAHALGCPSQPAAAAAWLTHAWRHDPDHRRPLGVAEAGTEPVTRRYFLAIAGVGYDAAIVAALRDDTKRRWGKLAFAARACTHWPGYFPAPLAVVPTNGPTLTAQGLLFSLTRFYAGRLRLGRLAAGEALVLVLRGAPSLLPFQALALCTTGLEHSPGVQRLRTAEVAIPTPIRPVQLDGEPAGSTPVRLSFLPRGIRFLSPR
ncbi:MAG: diacylglycerol/lipid kinase family protein [Terriglobales bacterium]